MVYRLKDPSILSGRTLSIYTHGHPKWLIEITVLNVTTIRHQQERKQPTDLEEIQVDTTRNN